MWSIQRIQKEFGYNEETAIQVMVRALVNWGQNGAPKTFDNFLIDDLSVRIFQSEKHLSYSQKNSLDNICMSYKVDIEKWVIDKLDIE